MCCLSGSSGQDTRLLRYKYGMFILYGVGLEKEKGRKKSGCSIEFKLLDTRRTRRLTTIAMSYVICADKLWNTSQLALAKCSIYISFPPICICVVC